MVAHAPRGELVLVRNVDFGNALGELVVLNSRHRYDPGEESGPRLTDTRENEMVTMAPDFENPEEELVYRVTWEWYQLVLKRGTRCEQYVHRRIMVECGDHIELVLINWYSTECFVAPSLEGYRHLFPTLPSPGTFLAPCVQEAHYEATDEMVAGVCV